MAWTYTERRVLSEILSFVFQNIVVWDSSSFPLRAHPLVYFVSGDYHVRMGKSGTVDIMIFIMTIIVEEEESALIGMDAFSTHYLYLRLF